MEKVKWKRVGDRVFVSGRIEIRKLLGNEGYSFPKCNHCKKDLDVSELY